MVADQLRKSLGVETTFARDLLSWDEVAPALEPVFAKLWAAYSRHGLTGRTVTVKIKYANFQQITRIRTCSEVRGDHRAACSRSSSASLPAVTGYTAARVTLSNFDAAIVAENRQISLAFR